MAKNSIGCTVMIITDIIWSLTAAAQSSESGIVQTDSTDPGSSFIQYNILGSRPQMWFFGDSLTVVCQRLHKPTSTFAESIWSGVWLISNRVAYTYFWEVREKVWYCCESLLYWLPATQWYVRTEQMSWTADLVDIQVRSHLLWLRLSCHYIDWKTSA